MRKLSHEEFIAKARAVHGDTYQYLSEYRGSGVHIQIACKIHGLFTQTPNAHISQAQGCPLCAALLLGTKRRNTTAVVLSHFGEVHGDRYDYSRVRYVGAHKPVEIVCTEHGAFFQSPQSHRKGRGCPQCATAKQQGWNIRRNRQIVEQFESLARGKHGTLFDYADTAYAHNQGKIQFRCTVHNQQLVQTARDHLDGYNPCTKCNHMKSSGEESIAAYLAMFTSVVSRDRTIIKPKELDIYLPERALAIEYCGMYWHSHADAPSEKADKHKHYQKYKDCAAAGIRLLTVFESDWEARKRAIKRLLRNAVGKGRGRLMARKCSLGKPSNAAAREFYDRYHPQGGAGGGEHYGLYWGGKLVACMRFALGHNDRGSAAKNRVWTLARYATRVNVAGGASKLFTAFLKDANPQEVKSFSDNRYFDGGMYAQLGFALDEETAPDYQVWSAKLGLLPKTHYQRRVIQKRLHEHDVDANFDADTDPRTEAEMTYLMGARRIYDCGKKRWVWF